MIRIIEICNNIRIALDIYLSKNHIVDYRVFLRKNESLYVDVLLHQHDDNLENVILREISDLYSYSNVEFVDNEEMESNNFYKKIFSTDCENKVILDNGRRRYNSVWSIKEKESNPCPVITFYSYKGGMGRTTTLAAYASYLAIHHHMKVAIIDCDIEAPGFTNFFLRDTTQVNQREGLIEYIIDKETKLSTSTDIRNYIWEADHAFTDEGTVYIMPCGNLDSSFIDSSLTHLDHYVEGISRIDLSNCDYAKNVFKNVIIDIHEQITPDVILIDSKTGISDIMGISVCELSDIVIGFFRSDVQSIPGLSFFIKIMLNNKGVYPIFVNSILPAGLKGKRLFEQFSTDVDGIADSWGADADIILKKFPIARVEELSLLGTQEEVIGELSETIRNGFIKEYVDLFDYITKSFYSDKQQNEDLKKQCFDIQGRILQKNKELLKEVNLYADNINIESDLKKGVFYYRRCMGDLLNKDKFLVIGNKGTGKSYLYKALQCDTVVNHIRVKTSKNEDYLFLYAIDRSNRILHTDKIESSVNAAAKYRYWVIFTWNAISVDLKKKLPEFNLDEGLIRLRPDDTDHSREELQILIQDEGYAQAIENEFVKLNNYLKELPNPTYLNIIYDQLDEIVNVNEWNVWIPDLVKYWRMSRFSHISSKIFMRTDLFRSLEVNNINELRNSSIDIEWSKEEMYSYFFQIVLAEGVADDFWKLMKLYGDYEDVAILNMKKEYENSRLKLSPMESKFLLPMVCTYFGENVDAENTTRMGNSFDWFYRNLKNADDTISLRPFISLIKSAIDKRMEMTLDYNLYKPVLYQKCYTDRTVRTRAVTEHYEDMIADMIGSKAIQYTFDYISKSRELRYKQISQRESVFEELLGNVIISYSEKDGMENMTIERLKELLIKNGIVCVKSYGNGNKYIFSFLYKYNLGLKGS